MLDHQLGKAGYHPRISASQGAQRLQIHSVGINAHLFGNPVCTTKT